MKESRRRRLEDGTVCSLVICTTMKRRSSATFLRPWGSSGLTASKKRGIFEAMVSKMLVKTSWSCSGGRSFARTECMASTLRTTSWAKAERSFLWGFSPELGLIGSSQFVVESERLEASRLSPMIETNFERMRLWWSR